MGRSVFINVSALERGNLRFEWTCAGEEFTLADNWTLSGELETAGTADLLDPRGSRSIRIRGRMKGAVENRCAIGLEPIRLEFDREFELFYYPMEMIAREEEKPLNSDDADIGFYEGEGLGLEAVVGEQIALWLPMRPECEYANADACPYCDRNLGRQPEQRDAQPRGDDVDQRWSTLQNWKLN